jgi:hypothetical protein
MGDSSSDDELPLAQRPVGGILLAAPGRAAPAADSSDESDFPSWLQTGAAGQKGKQIIALTDSDSDDAVLSPPKPPRPDAAPAAEAAEPTPAGNRDVQQPATQQTEEKKPLTAAKPTPRGAAKQKATPRGKAGAAGNGDVEAFTQPSTTQPATQPPASQPGGTAQKRAPAGLAHAPSSQMPLMLPEKLPQMKLLVELESSAGVCCGACCPTQQATRGAALLLACTLLRRMEDPPVHACAWCPHGASPGAVPPCRRLHPLPPLSLCPAPGPPADDVHGVTDLSGDSGAIGRLIIAGSKQEPQMQVDLKGALPPPTPGLAAAP